MLINQQQKKCQAEIDSIIDIIDKKQHKKDEQKVAELKKLLISNVERLENMITKSKNGEKNLDIFTRELDYKEYKKGEFIYHYKERCHFVYIILQGEVLLWERKEDQEFTKELELCHKLSQARQGLKEAENYLEEEFFRKKMSQIELRLTYFRKKEYEQMLKHQENLYYTVPSICNYKSSLILGPGIFIGENQSISQDKMEKSYQVLSPKCTVLQISAHKFSQTLDLQVQKIGFIQEILQSNFPKANKNSLLWLAYQAEEKFYNQGQIIFQEGYYSDQMYIVREGKVDFIKNILYKKQNPKVEKQLQLLQEKQIDISSVENGHIFGIESLKLKSMKTSVLKSVQSTEQDDNNNREGQQKDSIEQQRQNLNKKIKKSQYRAVASFTPVTQVYCIHKYLIDRVIEDNQDINFQKDFLKLQNIKLKWIDDLIKNILDFNIHQVTQNTLRKRQIKIKMAEKDDKLIKNYINQCQQIKQAEENSDLQDSKTLLNNNNNSFDDYELENKPDRKAIKTMIKIKSGQKDQEQDEKPQDHNEKYLVYDNQNCEQSKTLRHIKSVHLPDKLYFKSSKQEKEMIHMNQLTLQNSISQQTQLTHFSTEKNLSAKKSLLLKNWKSENQIQIPPVNKRLQSEQMGRQFLKSQGSDVKNNNMHLKNKLSIDIQNEYFPHRSNTHFYSPKHAISTQNIQEPGFLTSRNSPKNTKSTNNFTQHMQIQSTQSQQQNHPKQQQQRHGEEEEVIHQGLNEIIKLKTDQFVQKHQKFDIMIKTKEEFQERYMEKNNKPLQMLKQSDIERTERILKKYINTPHEKSLPMTKNSKTLQNSGNLLWKEFQKKKHQDENQQFTQFNQRQILTPHDKLRKSYDSSTFYKEFKNCLENQYLSTHNPEQNNNHNHHLDSKNHQQSCQTDRFENELLKDVKIDTLSPNPNNNFSKRQSYILKSSQNQSQQLDPSKANSKRPSITQQLQQQQQQIYQYQQQQQLQTQSLNLLQSDPVQGKAKSKVINFNDFLKVKKPPSSQKENRCQKQQHKKDINQNIHYDSLRHEQQQVHNLNKLRLKNLDKMRVIRSQNQSVDSSRNNNNSGSCNNIHIKKGKKSGSFTSRGNIKKSSFVVNKSKPPGIHQNLGRNDTKNCSHLTFYTQSQISTMHQQ